MKYTSIIGLILFNILVVSCEKVNQSNDGPVENYINKHYQSQILNSATETIPIDEALCNLSHFLEESDLKLTKSGLTKEIASVETFYSNSKLTKIDECIPSAYLVNFKNEEGYAILGANTSVVPIIAVIETGNTSWEQIYDVSDKPISGFEDYYLNSGIQPDRLIQMCVNGALYGENTEKVDTKSSSYTVNIPPITSSLNFGQQVTYCHKSNRGFVLNGCASTALSIAVAYNTYPILHVDHEYLHYNNCNSLDGSGIHYYLDGRNLYLKLSDYFSNSSLIPSSLSTSEQINLLTLIDSDIIDVHGSPTSITEGSFYRTRYKLTSSVFYILSNIIKSWDSTGTMPNAIVNGLEDLGYVNVDKVKKSSLTSSQISSIIDMLESDKPVIMCGWSLFSLPDSHYWIVDGIRQNSSQTFIHCNWGWEGSSNGWFVSECIRPTSGRPFDDGSIGAGTDNAWNNIIVFTYDLSSTIPNISVTELYDNRVTY